MGLMHSPIAPGTLSAVSTLPRQRRAGREPWIKHENSVPFLILDAARGGTVHSLTALITILIGQVCSARIVLASC